MFEELDSIDWQHLTHAYGPATDVPDLIRALASSDSSTLSEAYNKLYNSICHQGTVYEATAYAVPFLVELLGYESTKSKTGTLYLLSDIANGSSYLDAHKDLSFYDGKRDTPEFKAGLAEELAWVRRAYLVVGEGMPIYLELLIYPDAEIRILAVRLLSSFKELAQVSLPKLALLLTREKDPQVQAAALLSYGALSEPEAPQLERLWSYMTVETSPLLRFAAALAFARCARKATPPEVIDVLVRTVAEAEAINQSYSPLTLGVSFIPDGREALAHVEQVLAIPALIDVLRVLDVEEHAWGVVGVAEALLDLAFYGKRIAKNWTYIKHEKDGRIEWNCWRYPGQKRKGAAQDEIGDAVPAESIAESLTEVQRTVLAALVNYDPLWKINTNLFEVYGLPQSREALRKLLW